jgi:precorrin-8X/cobalt-precorrin-8 methylmutase
MSYPYIRDGAEIYRRSFAIIRAESDLARFTAEQEPVAVRVIHASGQVEAGRDLVFSPDFVSAARRALQNGAPILCDAKMVASGVTRARLPSDNQVICTLADPAVPALAIEIGNTSSAAALHLWKEHIAGAVVAIGNAPTALFHLLELFETGWPRPAAIIGMPVGFVGAAESKQALIDFAEVPFLVACGRRGGSAMTVAAINALASAKE